MRVLQIVGLSGPAAAAGGVWSVARAQARALREAGAQVHVLSGWMGGAPPASDAQATTLPTRLPPLVRRQRWLWSAPLWRAARRRARGADVVHLHLCRDFLTLPALWAMPRGPAVVAQTHGMLARGRPADRWFDTLFIRPVLSRVDRWLYLTDDERDDLARLGVSADRLVRVHNGTEQATASWHGDDSSTVAFVSRLHPRKNPGTAVRALALLAQRGTRARLVLAGPDQGELTPVLRLAAELGVSAQVDHVGQLDAAGVSALLASSAVMVLPSVAEPYPMVVLEAAALGMPVVVSTHTGVSDLLREADAALVCEPSPAALADALENVLLDRGLRSTLRANLADLYRRHWTLAALASQLLRVYESAGRAAGPRRRVTFVTNVAAPYRRPVWDAMGRSVDLTVALLVPDDRLAAEERNRGEDWRVGDGGGVDYTWPATRPLTLRGTTYHWGGRGLAGLVRRSDVLVLGGWESPVYWQLRLLALLLRVPCVGFYESTRASAAYRSGVVDAARAWFFRTLPAVVVPGHAAEDNLRHLGVDPARLVVGRNAVDVVAIAQAAARAREGAGSAAPGSFLFVGQLVERKNVAALLTAYARLSGEASLTVVGSGPQAGALAAQAASEVPAVAGRAAPVFLPLVPAAQVPALMAAHATLVLPSTTEVWGLVVNEALAAGLHVVVSRECGVAASVEGMRGVWVCDPDPASVAAAMDASRRAWTGPIRSPEVMAWTPQAFADCFLAAVHTAVEPAAAG